MKEEIMKHTAWFFSTDEILQRVHTTTEGISPQEAEKRLALFGSNVFNKKEKASILALLAKQFASPLIFILMGASVLTGVLQEWIDTAVIIGAVLVNVGLGFYREYHAENTLDALITYIKDRSRVVRNGIEQEVDSATVVVGDIIVLGYGSRVPADARLLSVNNLRVDEAILTGESVPIEKKISPVSESANIADRTNMVHAGTLIVEGFGIAVVVATGNETEIGKIAGIVSSIDRAETPIQKDITKISWFIFLMAIAIVALIFLIGISRGEPILQMLLLASAVAVGAVPEALPITLTVILSIGAERIAQRKGVVRKLAAAETLGSTTVIMTDKTGTLTKAEMELVGVYPLETLLTENPKEEKTSILHLSREQKHMLELATTNISVSIENPDESQTVWRFIGRHFEVNIAKACTLYGVSLKEATSKETLLRIPFNSTNKFSVAEKDGRYIVMGAPDILLKRSAIDKENYLRIESWIHKASMDGKRLIAIAEIDTKKIKEFKAESMQEMQFTGILAFYDPIREEVPEAIRRIESQGLKVIIITGDLKGTAIAVAQNLGWNISDTQVLTGVDLHTMSDETLLEVIPQIKIFARVTPEDKLRIGQLYRKLGEVVAMTGDGVNDAPALKAMDIGVSLGSGSDVAKSASDLVLLDDNFQTISRAIDEGRRILSNIRKTFVYLISTSLSEVFVIGGSLLAAIALPLSALQIIWVNLVTGSLPAIALAFDEDTDKERSGVTKSFSLVTSDVKFVIAFIGIVGSTAMFFLYYGLIQSGMDLSLARSIFFACFSSHLLVSTFSFRSLYHPLVSYNPFSNRQLNWSICIGFAVLIATMTIPAMRNIFNITAMPMQWMWIVVLWLVFNVVLVEVAKLWFRRRELYTRFIRRHT